MRPPIPAPTLSLPLVGGGSFRLATQRGRVVVMNFWASWRLPTTLVIDRQGRIRWRWPGEIQTRRLYAVLEELLR